jgi:HSP20 family molecular chaperone IbpA
MTTVIWKSQHGSSQPEKRRMLIDAIGWQVRTQSHVWSPPTELYELESAYIVRVEVSGMRQQDFSIKIENNYLAISGARPDKPERRAYHQMEVRYGEFNSVVAIPGPVDAENASAEYDDGFLIVHLPKAKNNKITIK